MNKPLQKLRRFFARTGTPKKYNATATRDDLSASYDEDESSNRLSGAFVVVLLLHIVALVGVFAFAKVKESRAAQMPPEPAKKAASTKPSAKSSTPAVAPALVASGAPAQENPAPTPRATAPSPAVAPETGRRHVVKIGETLGKISVAYTVPVSELMKSNNLKNETDVHTGQLLTIPEGKITAKQTIKAPEVAPAAPAKALPNSFIVRKNDTIAKIARELGVNYEEMVKLNGIKDPKIIQIGQVLKVPKKN